MFKRIAYSLDRFMSTGSLFHKLIHPTFFSLVALQICLSPTNGATLEAPPKWGSPDRTWGVRRQPTAADRAKIAMYRSGREKPAYFTTFNDPEELKSKWLLQSDDRANLKSCRRPENINVKTGVLKLRTEIATDGNARWSTGSMWSNFAQKYGFFEASIKATDVTGINNAFWMVTADGFEIDIAEVHYPGTVRATLHNHHDYQNLAGDNNWGPKGKSDSVGFANKFVDNLSADYHDYGVLWTPKEIIYEVDGEPINVIVTNGAIKEGGDIRFSTAVMDYAGKIPVHPENHDMRVNRLRVFVLNQ